MDSSVECEQKIRSTVNAYDRAPSLYVDKTYAFASYPGLEEEIRSFLNDSETGPVLDVGSGSNRDSDYIESLGRIVYSIDLSRGLLAEARRRGPQRRLICSDARWLPLRSDSIAAAICSGIYLHIPQPLLGVALSELRRVLQSGGRALISMKANTAGHWRAVDGLEDRWFERFDVQEFAEQCQGVGFGVSAVCGPVRRSWYSFIVTCR